VRVEIRRATYDVASMAAAIRAGPLRHRPRNRRSLNERTPAAWRRQPEGSYAETIQRGGSVSITSLTGVSMDLGAPCTEWPRVSFSRSQPHMAHIRNPGAGSR
jgi:hypothetical protein